MPTLRFRFLPGVFCALLSIGTTSVGHAAWPTDMLVTSGDGGTFVYLAIPEFGAIYRHKITAEDTRSVPFSAFEEFFRSPTFLRPTALGLRKGKLLFTDRYVHALVELDLATRQARPLITLPQIQDPVSLAVSDTGMIAIGEDGPDRIVLFAPGSAPRTLSAEIDEPDRLTFIGQDLLVLDRRSGSIRFVSAEDTKAQPAKSTTAALKILHKSFSRLDDVAVFRGLLYAVGGKQLLAFAPASGATVLRNVLAGSEPLRVAAEPDSLLIQTRDSVARIPRPTAASFGFELAVDKGIAEIDALQYTALTSLYAYLDVHGLLPVHEVEAARYYPSLKEMLWQEGVLIRRPEAPGVPAENSTADTQLGRVLCRLNELPCEAGTSAALHRGVAAGEKVRLPAMLLEKGLATSKVSLGDRTVQEHLLERVLPEQIASVEPDDLFRINRRFLQTWEAVAARDNLLALEQPSASLEPGSMVKLDKGRAIPFGSLTGCGVELGEVRHETVLERPLVPLRARGDILPRERPIGMESTGGPLGEVEFSFETLVSESLGPGVLAQATEALGQSGNCASLLKDPEVYVVVEARTALGTRYNLLGRNGEPRILTEEEIYRSNLRGHPDPEQEWSLVVDDPVSVAVRLAKLSDSASASLGETSPVLDSASDIFAIKSQVLYLPATKWRLSAFVLPLDLRNTTSEIGAIDATPGVDVLSEEQNLATPQSAAAMVIPDSDRDRILSNRKELETQIDYLAPTSSLSGFVIGIGEKKQSVHCSHPDFMAEGGNLWRQEKGEFDTEPMSCDVDSVEAGSSLIKEFLEDTEHGNHVAGLLANRGSLIPGLARGASLFLIDTSSPSGLDKSIENAVKHGVGLFSFSFALENDTALDRLKKTMRDKWSNLLFVAAAGNEGEDLTGVSAQPPITWGGDLENIIGVGASDWSHNVLGAWPNPQKPGSTKKGSNYGKKYVQILAPGFQIYSTASEGRYAMATGSSMAVPQVTAAIAILQAAQPVYLDPSIVKARLIYTADWYSPNFNDKVWGGSLNFRRCIWRADLNLLRDKAKSDTVKLAEFPGNPAITVTEGEIDDPDGDPVPLPSTIPFKNILRIQWIDAEKRWRVVYLESNTTSALKMRIIKGALLSGSIPCGQIRQWDPEHEIFLSDNLCTKDLDVNNIFDYVARLPNKKIRF